MKLNRILGAFLVLAGIVWSIGFPKSREILRPDFVASVAIGVGLIGTGVLTATLTRSRLATHAISAFLLWSLLLNIFLVATVRDWSKAEMDRQRMALEHRR